MKTKVGLPFGLTLALFIGVFSVMLTLGVLSPERADAAVTGTPTLELSTMVAGAYPDVTVTFENDGAITDGANIDLDFSDALVIGTAQDSVGHVLAESNWSIYGTDSDSESVMPLEVTISGTMITVDLPNDVGVEDDATVMIKYTQPKRDAAADPPVTDTGALVNGARGMVTVEVEVPTGTTETSDAVTLRAQLASVNMVNSPIDPGAVAQYRFTFTTPVALDAFDDSITLHFDKDIGNLGQLSGSDIRISSGASGEGVTPAIPARPATSPAAPTRSVITGSTNKDHVEYTIAPSRTWTLRTARR